MNVLLIDSSEQSLATINSALKKQGCKTAHTANAVTGLKLLQKHRFDVVIAADRLARTSLENLLKAIEIKFPTLIRIAVVTDKVAGIDQHTHYLYQRPVKINALISTIHSFSGTHQTITKKVVVQSVAKVKTLPSPPKVYMQLNQLLKKANVDSDKIANIISQDPALTAKVLQFTNNTFARAEKPITSITEAITKMGVDTLSCIVMTAELFSYQPNIPNFSILDEQLKALSTAKLAASLVPAALKQDALLAGLLHGIGKLVLFEIDKDLTLKYFKNRAKASDDVVLEKRIFSTDHCHVGAYLLHIWGFPYHLIAAILNQNSPNKLLEQPFGIAQATYLATALLKKKPVDKDFLIHYQLEQQLETLQDSAAKLAKPR
ncbi:response regulator [Thalassotalea sediminis]|uniref:response regulator n=1 Tax=Thalassotalea sediminis TaxID=1759089 RepID=UPI0025738739|nr:HDOD domain-containing protein [Thalassotalea sediminis]